MLLALTAIPHVPPALQRHNARRRKKGPREGNSGGGMDHHHHMGDYGSMGGAAAEMAKLAYPQAAMVSGKDIQAMQEALHFASTTLMHSSQVVSGGPGVAAALLLLHLTAGACSLPPLLLSLKSHQAVCHECGCPAAWVISIQPWSCVEYSIHPLLHGLPLWPLQVTGKPAGEEGGEEGEGGGGVAMGPNSMPFVPQPDVMMLLLKGYAGEPCR